jgi:chemotaxis signal transduction protein
VRTARVRSTHLIGRVGERLVALELPLVEQVLPMLRIDPCPGGPPALLGFATIAAEPVAVLGLRALFGLRPVEELAGVDQRVALCAWNGRRVGLALDHADGLGRPDALRSPTVEDRIVAVEVVRQVGVLGGRLCLVLDPAVAIDWLTRSMTTPQPQEATP